MSQNQLYLNDEEWNKCVFKLRDLAKDMLENRIGLNEGSIQISFLLNNLSDALVDPNFSIFIALSSDTTHLPIAHVRKHWNADSLAKADKELEEIESRYRDAIKNACEYLLIFNFDEFRANILKKYKL